MMEVLHSNKNYLLKLYFGLDKLVIYEKRLKKLLKILLKLLNLD